MARRSASPPDPLPTPRDAEASFSLDDEAPGAPDAFAPPVRADEFSELAELREALRACGQTAGTVVMQQRLIASLHEDVTTLRRQAVRRDRALLRRALAMALLVAAAVVGWMHVDARHEEALSRARADFDERLRATEAQRREALSTQLSEQRRQFEARQAARDREARAEASRETTRLSQTYDAALAAVLTDKNAEIAKLAETLAALEGAQQKAETARAELRAVLARALAAERRLVDREKVLLEWQRRALAAEAQAVGLAGGAAGAASTPAPSP